MKKDSVAALGCLGLIPVLVSGYMLRGWALVTLWSWFLTPVFHVAPPNGATSIGLAILGPMLSRTTSYESPDSDKNESAPSKLVTAYGRILLTPPFLVGVAWIVRHWA